MTLTLYSFQIVHLAVQLLDYYKNVMKLVFGVFDSLILISIYKEAVKKQFKIN